jgi:hypothetical protein
MTNTLRPIGAKVSIQDPVNPGSVHPKYPGIWTIKSYGPKNAVLDPVNGGVGLRAPKTWLMDPTTDTPSPSFATVELFNPGEFVRIPRGQWAGVWVVLADYGKSKVRLARPGGDNGKYLSATRRGLVKVTLQEFLGVPAGTSTTHLLTR